jgi:Xaa-Pro dipeptidase
LCFEKRFFVKTIVVGEKRYVLDRTTLFDHIVELRVIKTALEQDVLSYVARVSCEAHKHVMASVRPGMLEYQAEALFRYHCHDKGGCREQAYSCICACGPNAATLHYGHGEKKRQKEVFFCLVLRVFFCFVAGAPNERTMNSGECVLFDMGAEYHCYCSDVTACFPVSGTFSDKQAAVYNLVLDARDAVIAAMRPGVKWTDMHRLAERHVLQGASPNKT